MAFSVMLANSLRTWSDAINRMRPFFGLGPIAAMCPAGMSRVNSAVGLALIVKCCSVTRIPCGPTSHRHSANSRRAARRISHMVSASMMANTTQLMPPNQISQGTPAFAPLCQRPTAVIVDITPPANDNISGMQNSMTISTRGAGHACCA